MQVPALGSRCTGLMLPQPAVRSGRLPLTSCRLLPNSIRQRAAASAEQSNEPACISSSSSHVRRSAALAPGVFAPAIAQLAVASPAQADDTILAAGSAAEEAAGTATETGAASASSSLITLTDAAPDDPVVTVLFYVAIGILSVVTLGVAYLALTGYLDDRKEKDDRKAFESQMAQRAVAQDREKAAAIRKPPRRRSSGTGKGGGKGFS